MLNEERLTQKIGAIETKLDKISEALTLLARVEERQAQSAEALGRAWKTIESIELRISQLEKTEAQTMTRQAMWAVIVLLTGVIGYLIK
jgi:hypothetical protein